MKSLRTFGYLIRKNYGFTLVELLAVISIMGIVTAIVVLSVVGVKGKTEKEVCYANQLQLEREYHTHLVIEGLEHTVVLFAQYQQQYDEELCPVKGLISYINGHVECSVHPRNYENKDQKGEEGDVPFLWWDED
jgi:prepilin-type N-terminal cleavage/methylation domain-containing protein